jgi:hypothetical protein
VHKPQVPISPLGSPQINSIFVADHHGSSVEFDDKKYVLTIVDETSLWVELVAVASYDAQTFVNAFVGHVIARHDCPYGIVIRNDKGSAFISQVSKAFYESFGVMQEFSSPYHHTSIARVEQSSVTVKNALKILCLQRPTYVIGRGTCKLLQWNNFGIALYSVIGIYTESI